MSETLALAIPPILVWFVLFGYGIRSLIQVQKMRKDP